MGLTVRYFFRWTACKQKPPRLLSQRGEKKAARRLRWLSKIWGWSNTQGGPKQLQFTNRAE
jgi:hypothetical protein